MLTLFLTGIPLLITAVVGFIARSGVTVLNSPVIITFINQLCERGAGSTMRSSRAHRSGSHPYS